MLISEADYDKAADLFRYAAALKRQLEHRGFTKVEKLAIKRERDAAIAERRAILRVP